MTERGEDVAILCAGFKGAFALDDAYCAGRIVQELSARRSDAAIAASSSRALPGCHTGLTARTYGPPGLEEDIRFCARESVLELFPVCRKPRVCRRNSLRRLTLVVVALIALAAASTPRRRRACSTA